MRGHARPLAWLGGLAVLAAAVVALRQSQPPATPAEPDEAGRGQTMVTRFAAAGVSLPEIGRAPQPPLNLRSEGSGPGRIRVAWGPAVTGGRASMNAVGYEVSWSPLGRVHGAEAQHRLVTTPELELSGLPDAPGYEIEVRSVDAYGRRSAPVRAVAVPGADDVVDPARYTGLAEQFDGPFSVDTAVVGARWHLSGYPGCTDAAPGVGAVVGMLTVDLNCGNDLAVLRARSPMRLQSPNPAGERGRVAVVTDGGGPRSQLTISLVPGPADEIGTGQDGSPPAPSSPLNSRNVIDPALPDGTLQVLVDDLGPRLVTGLNVPATDARLATPPAAASRGVGVLHRFEVVINVDRVSVLQDGVAVAVAAVAPSWAQAHLLIGMSGPPGSQATVRLDAVGFTGPATAPPATFVQPIVPATQRVIGPLEQAPGVGISRQPLTGAAAARLVTTVATQIGVDLGAASVQLGDVAVPVRPVLGGVPVGVGAATTMTGDVPAQLVGPDGPTALSPMVLRAPGAEQNLVTVTNSYLEIVPLPGRGPPAAPAKTAAARSAQQQAMPSPALRLLDTNLKEVTAVAPGARLRIEVTLDGLGAQLRAGALAPVAGFELWMDNRLLAGVPTAAGGGGVGGVYVVDVTLDAVAAGRHFVELREIAADPPVPSLSVLKSWELR